MSVLKEFRVTLETVTPLFLGGAEARGLPDPIVDDRHKGEDKPRYTAKNVKGGEPELRSPAFRGALRYWLRTLIGETTDGDIKKLQEIENSVFGSASSEQGAGSPVRILVKPQHIKPSELFQLKPDYVERKKEMSGWDYLFWSMNESSIRKKEDYQPKRKYLPEGCTFDLKIASHFYQEDALQKAVASLWTLVHFGGIGSRSRRTAGSLRAALPAEYVGLNFQLQSRTPEKIADELFEGLQKAQNLAGVSVKDKIKVPFDMFSLAHDSFQSWVLGSWDSSEAAIKAIGKSLQKFRTYREPDHKDVFRWLNGDSILTVHRSVFGLPIPYKYSTRNKPEGVIQGEKNKIERRASPLWLKVSKTGGNPARYVVVATLFKSDFLPNDQKLHLTSVKNSRAREFPPVDPPRDYSLIQEWIASMEDDTENFNQVAVVM